MKLGKNMFFVFIGVAAFLCFLQPLWANERGAKSLFYDSMSGGSPQGVESSGESKAVQESVSGSKESIDSDHIKPGILYWIELVQQDGGNKRVSNDRLFRSGDKIRIHITPNTDGYLHILHKGSTGAMQLIPIPKSENGWVKMGGDYRVPSEDGWLKFDENPGKESLKLIFASEKSSTEVITVMKTASAPGAPEKLMALWNEYGSSKHLVSQVESGSKDLIVEGPAAQPPADKIQPFTTSGKSGFTVDSDTYNAPAHYVVNTNAGSVKEPVIVDIVLSHQP